MATTKNINKLGRELVEALADNPRNLRIGKLRALSSPPKSFRTSQAWATKWECSLSRAMGRIQALVLAGKMEREVYKIDNGVRVWPTPFYRMLK